MSDLHPYTRSAIASVRLERGDVTDADAELIDSAVRGDANFDDVIDEILVRRDVVAPTR